MPGIKKKQKGTLKIPARLFTATLFSFFLTSITCSLGTVVDGMVIGNTMTYVESGASGLVNPFCFLFALIGGVLGSGMNDLCAKALVEGKEEEAKKIYSVAFTYGLLVSILMTVLILALSYPATMLLGAQPGTDVFRPCRAYLTGVVIGIPGMTLMTILSCGAQIEGRRKWPIYSMIAMTIFNILGDYLAVYAFHGGILSLALATSFSYYAGSAVLIFKLRSPETLLRPELTLRGGGILKDIIFRGTPMGICRITTSVRGLYLNKVLASQQTAAGLAAYNVQVQVNYLTNAFFMGVAQALVLIVCIYYVEEDQDALVSLAKRSLLYEIVIGSIISISLIVFTVPIAQIYLGPEESDALLITEIALFLFALCLPAQGVVVLFANYLKATGHVFMSNLMYVFADVVLLIPSVIHIRQHYLTDGELSDMVLMVSTFLGVTLAAYLSLLLIPIVKTIVNKRISFGWKSLLLLPKSFGPAKEDEIRASINSIEDAADYSEKAMAFCREKGIPARTAYLTSLAAEEMAANVIKHGFNDGKKHLLEIRLVRKDDDLILRIRDNCKAFDPKAFYQAIYTKEDHGASIGLRMVIPMAKEVSYTSLLRLNNLMLRF